MSGLCKNCVIEMGKLLAHLPKEQAEFLWKTQFEVIWDTIHLVK